MEVTNIILNAQNAVLLVNHLSRLDREVFQLLRLFPSLLQPVVDYQNLELVSLRLCGVQLEPYFIHFLDLFCRYIVIELHLVVINDSLNSAGVHINEFLDFRV
jgi:hypothetical protein